MSLSIVTLLLLAVKLFVAVYSVPSTYISPNASGSMRMRMSRKESFVLTATCCDKNEGECTNKLVVNVGTLISNVPSALVMAVNIALPSVRNWIPARGFLSAWLRTTPCNLTIGYFTSLTFFLTGCLMEVSISSVSSS